MFDVDVDDKRWIHTSLLMSARRLDRQPSPPSRPFVCHAIPKIPQRDPNRLDGLWTTPPEELSANRPRYWPAPRRRSILLTFESSSINIHWDGSRPPYRMTYGSEDATEVPEFEERLLPASVNGSASPRGPTEHRRLAMRIEGSRVGARWLFTTNPTIWCLISDEGCTWCSMC